MTLVAAISAVAIPTAAGIAAPFMQPEGLIQGVVASAISEKASRGIDGNKSKKRTAYNIAQHRCTLVREMKQ